MACGMITPDTVGGLRRQAAEGAGDENAKLKKLLSEAMLDNGMLKDVASKMVTSAARREAVTQCGTCSM